MNDDQESRMKPIVQLKPREGALAKCTSRIPLVKPRILFDYAPLVVSLVILGHEIVQSHTSQKFGNRQGEKKAVEVSEMSYFVRARKRHGIIAGPCYRRVAYVHIFFVSWRVS